jgi:hypothetical protein
MYIYSSSVTNNPLLANLLTLLSYFIELYIEFIFKDRFFWWNVLSTRVEGSLWLSYNLLFISNPTIEHLLGDLQPSSSISTRETLKSTIFLLPLYCFEVIDSD